MSILAFFYSLHSFSLGDLILTHNFSWHIALDDSSAGPDYSSELQTHTSHHLTDTYTLMAQRHFNLNRVFSWSLPAAKLGIIILHLEWKPKMPEPSWTPPTGHQDQWTLPKYLVIMHLSFHLSPEATVVQVTTVFPQTPAMTSNWSTLAPLHSVLHTQARIIL